MAGPLAHRTNDLLPKLLDIMYKPNVWVFLAVTVDFLTMQVVRVVRG